jgi:aspartate kinase
MAAKVFSVVAAEGINILLISQSSSEQNICFAVERKQNNRVVAALEEKLQLELGHHVIENIESFDNAAIIAVVGAGLKTSPGIAARVFSSLGNNGINVVSIAQGSSEYNLSLVVAESEVEEALARIHSEFF